MDPKTLKRCFYVIILHFYVVYGPRLRTYALDFSYALNFNFDFLRIRCHPNIRLPRITTLIYYFTSRSSTFSGLKFKNSPEKGFRCRSQKSDFGVRVKSIQNRRFRREAFSDVVMVALKQICKTYFFHEVYCVE